MQWPERLRNRKLVPVMVVAAVMLISAVTHRLNMFGFPYFENDEGIYVSQGWSAFNLGKLSPYTYWYDHAPAGWILIGLWQRLSGGVFAFGMSVASGRMLMWILHIGSSAGLLYIGKKITGRWLPGVIAVLVFSLSPLAIYYQRRVLLDNIAIFWVIASLAVTVRKPMKVWGAVFGAGLAGISVLSKEVTVFFLPAWLYVIWINSKKNRPFVLAGWITVFGLVVATYFLFAWLKGELLPYGFLGDTRQRVSLLDTLGQQLSRGISYQFWDKRSLFYQNWQVWLLKDAVLTWGMAITGGVTAILGIWWKRLRIPVVFFWCFALFLLRSRLIIDFYLIPVIPFAALGFGVLISELSIRVKNSRRRSAMTISAIFLTAMFLGRQNIGQYNRNENLALAETVGFLKQKANPDDLIIADSSIYLDLILPRFPNDRVFSNVQWAWKIEQDQEVINRVMKYDWRNIKYIAVSHEMLKQIRDFDAETIKTAIDNSDRLMLFTSGSTAYLDFGKYISTNGDWMGVLKVKDQTSIILDNAWAYYKKNFIYDYGQVIDPQTENTTSEGQAYAMLRAVWENDKTTFDGVWAWTKDHMQYRNGDKLFSWVWVKQNGNYVLGDFASAADADVDIALALLQASKRWQSHEYLNEARIIIRDIWRKEVILINGQYYLTAGSDSKREAGYLVNPSYFSPAAYRIFAQADPDDGWSKLVKDTYSEWTRISKFSGETPGLIPDWVWIGEKLGELQSADIYLGRKGSKYGYDAFRGYFRAAMDYKWYQNGEAGIFLNNAGKFFTSEWRRQGKIWAEYELNGDPIEQNESLSITAGALFATNVTDPQAGSGIFTKYYNQTNNPGFSGFWGDGQNYYDQNWAWFATALYNDRMVNYW